MQKKYGKMSDSSFSIGESWEASALPGYESLVKKGEFSGKTLSELYNQNPELFGIDSPHFPFLIKLIDAKSWLSVQVHHHKKGSGAEKCEAWVVLKANPGAQLILGDKFNNRKDLEKAVESGTLLEYLHYHEVQQGDAFFVPSGTIHAIGSGLLIYEIQQPSDITYRLHDFSRNRMLHIRNACAAYDQHTDYQKISPQTLPNGNRLMICCEYFAVELIDAQYGSTQCINHQFACFTALERGNIAAYGKQWPYRGGDTFLIPAGFGEFELNGASLLKAYVPTI